MEIKAGTEGRIHRKQQTVGPFSIGFKIESYNYKVFFLYTFLYWISTLK